MNLRRGGRDHNPERMELMEQFHVQEAIKARRSVRTFSGSVTEDDREKLMAFADAIQTPFNVPVRFSFLDHAGKDAGETLGSKGLCVGTDTYIAAAVEKGIPYNLEAFGYAFETLVLYATSLKIGTVILAGTLERKGFEHAIRLGDHEIMPTVTPVGYISENKTVKERAMRRVIKADTRKDWDQIFFEERFGCALSHAKADSNREALEAFRWAPSATNSQPWAVVELNGAFHFFQRHDRAYGRDPESDIQRVDMGIALANFCLTAEETDMKGELVNLRDTIDPAAMNLPEQYSYTISWRKAL